MRNNAATRKHRFLTAHRQNTPSFFSKSEGAKLTDAKALHTKLPILKSQPYLNTRHIRHQQSFSFYKLLTLAYLLLGTTVLAETERQGDTLSFQIHQDNYLLACTPNSEDIYCVGDFETLREWLEESTFQEICDIEFSNIIKGDQNLIPKQEPIFSMASVDLYAGSNTTAVMTKDLQCMYSTKRKQELQKWFFISICLIGLDMIHIARNGRDFANSQCLMPCFVMLILPLVAAGVLLNKLKDLLIHGYYSLKEYIRPFREVAAIRAGLNDLLILPLINMVLEYSHGLNIRAERLPELDEDDIEAQYGSTSHSTGLRK